MRVNDYTENALKTYKDSSNRDFDLSHYMTALAEEVGECCSIVKRHFRGDFDFWESQEERERMIKELGDVLWYINAVSKLIDSDLETVMRENNKKLLSRLARGKLKGRGDDR